jgi:hypothetical protein
MSHRQPAHRGSDATMTQRTRRARPRSRSVIGPALLAVLLSAGCSAGPGGASGLPASSASPIAPSVSPPVAPVSAVPTATLEQTVYTPDDEQIATVIRAAVDEAIPQLKALNRSDPSALEDLFLPLGEWIAATQAAVEAHAPSSCTADAVELFLDGLDQYDDIREKFLEWRDWGANGNAFPPGAPNVAVAMFEEALVELDAHCPAT